MEQQPIPIAAPIHPPTAPPMARTFGDTGSTSRWPTAVSTIALVFGSLTAIGGIMGLSSPFTESIMPPIPGDAAMKAMHQVAHQWRLWTITGSIATLVAAVLLLVGAVRLLKRRSSCRKLLLIYGVIAICQGLGGTIVGYYVQRDTMAALQDIQGANPLPSSFGVIPMIVGLVISVLWAVSLPVFLLIWLNLAKIRQEVEGWSAGND